MRNKLGIVVPYRNRYQHLTRFLTNIQAYLDKTDLKYTIILVEQDNASSFNRGMLCNIGFLEAKRQKCNYVVFHDVDMIPIDVDYSYSDHPVHLATDNIHFKSYFGGITLFPADIFEKLNGFSNLYWGWGFEDDDLRYRCVKNGVKFETEPVNTLKTETKVPIFNGVDAYMEIPNSINFLRNFTVSLNIILGRLAYNKDKDFDSFPIFNIKGNDFTLSYTSFNRFYLSFFDSNGKYYDLHSNIIEQSYNSINITYHRDNKEISLFINDELEGTITMEAPIHRYEKEEIIKLGTNSENTEYFKGSITDVTLNNNGRVIAKYGSSESEEYILEDLSNHNNHGTIHNVYYDIFDLPVNYYGYIPFRRPSKLYFLKHDSNGFNSGRWKDDLTRWNQLRYNNEVQVGSHDNIEDGLTSCKYTVHSKTQDKTVTHMTVGI